MTRSKSRLVVFLLSTVLLIGNAFAAPWLMWGKAHSITDGINNDAIDIRSVLPVLGLDSPSIYPVINTLGPPTQWFANPVNSWTFDFSSTVPEIPSTDINNGQVLAAAYITAPTGGDLIIGAAADDWTTIHLNYEAVWRGLNTSRTVPLRQGLNILVVTLGENGGGYNGNVYQLNLPGDATIATTYSPAAVPPRIDLSTVPVLEANEALLIGSSATFTIAATHLVSGVTANLTSVKLDAVEQLTGPVAATVVNDTVAGGRHVLEITATDSNGNESYRELVYYGVASATISALTAALSSPANGDPVCDSADILGKAFAGGNVLATEDGALLAFLYNNQTFSGSPARMWVEYSPTTRNWGSGPALAGENVDNYTVRLVGVMTLSDSGNHYFNGGADDRIDIYVDGASAKNQTLSLAAGDHAVAIEFTEYGGGANFYWYRTGPGTMTLQAVIADAPAMSGYQVEYDAVESGVVAGQLVARDYILVGGYHYPRTETVAQTRYVTFDNGNFGPFGPPAVSGYPAMPVDSFGVELAGEFYAEAEDDYTASGWADDRIAVIIDGTLLFENASFVTGLGAGGPIHLTQGWHDLIIIFQEGGGNAAWDVWWSRAGAGGTRNFEGTYVRSATDPVLVTHLINASSDPVGDASNDGLLATWDLTGVANGSYPLRLTATDVGGNTEVRQITVTVQDSLTCAEFTELVANALCERYATAPPNSRQEAEEAINAIITEIFGPECPPSDQSREACRAEILNGL